MGHVQVLKQVSCDLCSCGQAFRGDVVRRATIFVRWSRDTIRKITILPCSRWHVADLGELIDPNKLNPRSRGLKSTLLTCRDWGSLTVLTGLHPICLGNPGHVNRAQPFLQSEESGAFSPSQTHDLLEAQVLVSCDFQLPAHPTRLACPPGFTLKEIPLGQRPEGLGGGCILLSRRVMARIFGVLPASPDVMEEDQASEHFVQRRNA
jgi:hypothetical protein